MTDTDIDIDIDIDVDPNKYSHLNDYSRNIIALMLNFCSPHSK